MFFSYRVNAKNQKDIVTEKEDKKTRSSAFSYFLSFFYGKKTKPRGMADSRKGSQIGVWQGREERAIGLHLCW